MNTDVFFREEDAESWNVINGNCRYVCDGPADVPPPAVSCQRRWFFLLAAESCRSSWSAPL